jgi:hypothetical protein
VAGATFQNLKQKAGLLGSRGCRTPDIPQYTSPVLGLRFFVWAAAFTDGVDFDVREFRFYVGFSPRRILFNRANHSGEQERGKWLKYGRCGEEETIYGS